MMILESWSRVCYHIDHVAKTTPTQQYQYLNKAKYGCQCELCMLIVGLMTAYKGTFGKDISVLFVFLPQSLQVPLLAYE
jgi:hypothetical protein